MICSGSFCRILLAGPMNATAGRSRGRSAFTATKGTGSWSCWSLLRTSFCLSPAASRIAGRDEMLGRMVVLTDITELSRGGSGENGLCRHASHERARRSAIRAAVETLTSLDWTREPDAGRRFLSVIDRQSGRIDQENPPVGRRRSLPREAE